MLSLVLYPYVYLLSRSAFLEQSICSLEVSRTLGCTPAQAMWRVALPLARPSIVAGMALALLEALKRIRRHAAFRRRYLHDRHLPRLARGRQSGRGGQAGVGLS